MSHQTGIEASEDLKNFFSQAKSGNTRLIKVSIEDEALILSDHKDVNGTWEDDFDACVLSVIEEAQPCYIFYRLDSKNNLGFEWLFIAYSPDNSPVRQKMLYAGTRSTIKTEFGGGLIAEEVFGTIRSDVSLEGYKQHRVTKTSDAPLSNAEIELKEVKQQHRDAAVTTKASTLPGISFPMDDSAIDALISIAEKKVSYVQLSIDVTNEVINLEKTEDSLEPSDLSSQVPADKPRYHFFLFKHTHEGDYLESIVFIYSMPGYSCSVKERMLYSSCKAALLSGCEDVLKMEVTKKLEISEGSELSAESLQDELHPQKNVHRQKFSKPKPPGGRGAKRLIKKDNQTGEEANQ